ncbi:hypothetical protein HZS_560 [Henneguya salminicola]|nr:hypothetical protein HZS_560 [Henneguya salminicola]
MPLLVPTNFYKMADIINPVVIKCFDEKIIYSYIINDRVITINENYEFVLLDSNGSIIIQCNIHMKKNEKITKIIFCNDYDSDLIVWLIQTNTYNYLSAFNINNQKFIQVELPAKALCLSSTGLGVIFIGFENGHILGIDMKFIDLPETVVNLNPCCDKNMTDFINNNKIEQPYLPLPELNCYNVFESSTSVTAIQWLSPLKCIIVGQRDGTYFLFDVLKANKIGISNDTLISSVKKFRYFEQPYSNVYYLMAIHSFNGPEKASVTIHKVNYQISKDNSSQKFERMIPVCKIIFNCSDATENGLMLNINHAGTLDARAFYFYITTITPTCAQSYLCIFDCNIFASSTSSNKIILNVTQNSIFSDHYVLFLDIRKIHDIHVDSIFITASRISLLTVPIKYRRKICLSTISAADYLIHVLIVCEKQLICLTLSDRISYCGQMIKRLANSISSIAEHQTQDILYAAALQHLPSPISTLITVLLYTNDSSALATLFKNPQFKETQLRTDLFDIVQPVLNRTSKNIVKYISGHNFPEHDFLEATLITLADLYEEANKCNIILPFMNNLKISSWLSLLSSLLKLISTLTAENIDLDAEIPVNTRNGESFFFYIVKILDANLKSFDLNLWKGVTIPPKYSLRELFLLLLIKAKPPLIKCYICSNKIFTDQSNFQYIQNCENKLVKTLALLSLDNQIENKIKLIEKGMRTSKKAPTCYLTFVEKLIGRTEESLNNNRLDNILPFEVLPNEIYPFINIDSVKIDIDTKYFDCFNDFSKHVKISPLKPLTAAARKRKYSEFHEDIKEFIDENIQKETHNSIIKSQLPQDLSLEKPWSFLESTRGPELVQSLDKISPSSSVKSNSLTEHEPSTFIPVPTINLTLTTIDESERDAISLKRTSTSIRRRKTTVENQRKYNLRARNTISTVVSHSQSIQPSLVNTNLESNLSTKTISSKKNKKTKKQTRIDQTVDDTAGDYMQLRSRRIESISSSVSTIVSNLRSKKKDKNSTVSTSIRS